MWRKSYKRSNYKRPEIIKNSKNKKLRGKGQIKDFKRERHLSKLYSNNNGLKIAHI